MDFMNPSDCIFFAMRHHSEELLQKEQNFLAECGFHINLAPIIRDEICTIFHKNNIDTYRKLFPDLLDGGIYPWMLIIFFNITKTDLNLLLNYMVQQDIFFNRTIRFDERSLGQVLNRFQIPLWDEGGICNKLIKLNIIIEEDLLANFTISDILKISNVNLDTNGRAYLINKFKAKTKENKEIITHLFLDGKNKFDSLKEVRVCIQSNCFGSAFDKEVKFLFKYFDHDLDLIKNTMKVNGFFLGYLPNRILQKISNVKEFFINAGPQSVQFASDALLDDEEVAMNFLKNDSYSLSYLSSRLRDDYKFLMKFYKNKNNEFLRSSSHCYFTPYHYEEKSNCYLGPSVLDNKWFIKEHLKRMPSDYVYISKRLKKDLSILELTNPLCNVSNLKFAGKNIYNNREFILPFIKKFGYPFKWVSNKYGDDYELCDIAVTRYGSYIQYASERLKNNKKLALKAVAGSYSSYQYLSSNLKKDEDVIKEAIRRNIKVSKFISKKIRKDKNLWLNMIDKKSLPIRSIFLACHFTLRRDPDIYEKTLNKDPSLADCFSAGILLKLNYKKINKKSLELIYRTFKNKNTNRDIFFLASAKKHILNY
tara:strand:+ start:466 stop:2244 length:1779 start_codon:yes stop_codon:yes gene_type:complete